MTKLVGLILLLALASTVLSAFDITSKGQTGTALNKQTCNVQTTLDFRFSSNSISGTSSTYSSSSMSFLDRYGKDLNLPLFDFAIIAPYTEITGYAMTGALSHAVIFLFSDGTNQVYVVVPFSTAAVNTDADVVDLTSTNSLLPSNSLGSFTASSALSAFNFLINTDYNQWYTSVVGTRTILVSKFVYKVSSALAATGTASLATDISTNYNFGSTIGSTGDKLCYASLTAGNFQTHMRQSVPLWFVQIGSMLYWLVYLFSDPTTKSVYSKDKHKEDPWTTWSMYSITHLAHEQFFTRLLRLTVVMIQWTIQGVFIASIIAAQYTRGAAIIIWSAVIAWVATLIFPFIWGSIFHTKIYEKYLAKYELKKRIMTTIDKEKTHPLQEQIDTIEQKLYGYYHWFYCIVFIIFFICWPITINRLQQLPRQFYYYHWYWLAAMGIVFFLEYFVMEPLMLLFFHNRDLFKARGGYYYDHRLGQLYQEVHDL